MVVPCQLLLGLSDILKNLRNDNKSGYKKKINYYYYFRLLLHDENNNDDIVNICLNKQATSNITLKSFVVFFGNFRVVT